jgi:Ribbon-helix-helix domain
MVRINLFLSGPQMGSLRALSERTDISVAELIRRAVDLLLAAEKNAPPVVHKPICE